MLLNFWSLILIELICLLITLPQMHSDIEIHQDPIALRRSACHPANLIGMKMATTVIFGAQTRRTGRKLKISAKERALIWHQSPPPLSTTMYWRERTKGECTSSGLEVQTWKSTAFGSGQTAVSGISHFGDQENPMTILGLKIAWISTQRTANGMITSATQNLGSSVAKGFAQVVIHQHFG